MQCSLSPGVRRPRFLNRGRPWAALISAFRDSVLVTSRTRAVLPRRGLRVELLGLAKTRQFLSNSRALSTSPCSVVGWGESNIIFPWSAPFRAFLNANILVASSIFVRQAYWLHSWYHSLNSRFPIGRLWILTITSCWVSGGMNWALKASLKSAHVP